MFSNLVWHWHECAKPNGAPCQWRPWHVSCLPYPRYATDSKSMTLTLQWLAPNEITEYNSLFDVKYYINVV
jgi:hypothetical protein